MQVQFIRQNVSGQRNAQPMPALLLRFLATMTIQPLRSP
jgi:hypothetical protein